MAPRFTKNGAAPPSSTSSIGRTSDGRTDGRRTDVGLSDGRSDHLTQREEGWSVRRPIDDDDESGYLTLWKEKQSDRPSEGGRRGEGALVPCDYCGQAEIEHTCQESWRWLEVIPLETDHLARYLADVWGIRNAELVALETGPYAIRDALLMVWRGSKEGRRYENPAGLIVKLARRVANAADRAQRRRR